MCVCERVCVCLCHMFMYGMQHTGVCGRGAGNDGDVCVCTHVELARTIYIRCIYGIFGRKTTKYTVIYGVYIRLWPTLYMSKGVPASSRGLTTSLLSKPRRQIGCPFSGGNQGKFPGNS